MSKLNKEVATHYTTGRQYQPYFTDEFDSYRSSYPEMDEVHAAITFALSANPRLGTLIEDFPHPTPTTRLFKTTSIGKTPGFQVLYRYTDTQVILLSIDRY